jgi:hypothetical protein
MSDGRQSALAGTLIGPSLQASQTPVTSVAPVLEWTIRRHGTLSGSPRRWSWMLVPHEVAVRAAVEHPVKTVVGRWQRILIKRYFAGPGPAAPVIGRDGNIVGDRMKPRPRALRVQFPGVLPAPEQCFLDDIFRRL